MQHDPPTAPHSVVRALAVVCGLAARAGGAQPGEPSRERCLAGRDPVRSLELRRDLGAQR